MDNAFFISRDAQSVAHSNDIGDAGRAAQLLREDCAHMNPAEFSSLLRQTKADECPNPRADIALFRDGNVMVRSQDGRMFPAGQLPPQEMARLIPPPPVPPPCPIIIENRPPVIECRPPAPVYVVPEPHRMYVPPGHVYIQSRGLNNTVVDTLGGVAAGAILDRKHPAEGAALGGIIGLGVGTALDNANK